MDVYADLRIESIRDLEFYMAVSQDVDMHNVNINLEAGHWFAEPDTQTVRFVTEVIYTHKSEENYILKYVNEVRFYIQNFSEVIQEKNNKYYMDKGFVHLFVDILLPTIRGILFAKTAGTNLSRAYLPLIKADRLIK